MKKLAMVKATTFPETQMPPANPGSASASGDKGKARFLASASPSYALCGLGAGVLYICGVFWWTAGVSALVTIAVSVVTYLAAFGLDNAMGDASYCALRFSKWMNRRRADLRDFRRRRAAYVDERHNREMGL